MKNEILGLVRDYASEQLKTKDFVPGKTLIPASGASLSAEDVETLTEAVLSLWYTEGKFCAKFRRELSKLFKKPYITLCNSGSSASLLAIKTALEVFPYKDYIITCGTNFPTTVSPIYQCGQIPIYIDIDTDTLSPNMGQFMEAIDRYGDKVSGIIFAHTLGFPFDEQAFDEINPGFTVIDCCDAVGAEVPLGEDYVPVGTFSDISTVSFFPAHHITAGEGGAVLCHNEDLSKIVDSNANWGRDCYCAPGQVNTCGNRFGHVWDKMPEGYDHKYTFTRLGYNLKMTEWQAALGFSQIKRVNDFINKRALNYIYLMNNLWIFREFFEVGVKNVGSQSPFGFPILVKDGAPFQTRELINYLEEHKIATRRVFAGNITRQPGFQQLPKIAFDLSGSDKIMQDMFWIGVQPNLTTEMLNYVLEVFDKFFKEKNL